MCYDGSMRNIRWYWIGIAGILVTVIVSFIVLKIVGNQSKKPPQTEEADRPFPSIVQNQYRPLPNRDKYDVSHYIRPLESNLTGIIYSKTAQIQGDVVSWEGESVSVNTFGEKLKIYIPPTLYLMCYSSNESNFGKDNVIFIFYKDDRNIGTLTKREYIQKNFPLQSNIILLADVESNNNMTAFLVVGIDCTENPL
jgi:hypothetical protein